MNGICHIDLNGNRVSFLFGMRSVSIYQSKVLANNLKQIEIIKANNPDLNDEDVKALITNDSFKLFTYIVYGGMCNYADLKDEMFPTFEQAYEVAEQLNFDNELYQIVMNAFESSKATQETLKALNLNDSNEKKKKQTRSKLKHTQ
jgi:hypothetical protein